MAERDRSTRSCEHCGGPIKRRHYSEKRYARSRFCSRKCSNRHRFSRPLWDRLWSRVERGPGCWVWTGCRSKWGYGQIGSKGRMARTHRVSWELTRNRPVPEGLHVLHRCDNPPCVRPSHLYVGTDLDNARDRVARGRSWTKLTKADVVEIRERAASGEFQTSLALEFGVTQPVISHIVHRKNWKHVP